MRKKSTVLLVIITITLLVMTGCTRSATRAARATPTAEGESPFPVSTQSQIMVDILAGTQTAQALTPTAAEKSTSVPTIAPATGGIEPTKVPATPESEEEDEPDSYPTATPGSPATYTIQKDEFPFCIARRFNVDPVELLSVNGLNMDSYVVVGFKLTIPQSGKFPYERALKSHPTDYTVLAGDSIGKIACSFGDVDPYNIYAVNGLEQGSAIEAGQVLHIP